MNPLAMPSTWDLAADGYAAEVVPLFTPFAADALRLAGASPGGCVLDVACGPGTLALLAAKTAARVDALDFSPSMVAKLAAAAPANVFPLVGDGQALPYEAATFDAAFSLFGLIFFPDRAKGLGELRRVLKPGGRVAISSWPPAEQAPLMDVLFSAMREEKLNLPSGKPALGDPADYEAELGAAGFRDVRVEAVTHDAEGPSLDAMWGSLQRSMAPLMVLRKMLGEERWQAFAGGVRERLASRFGTGPQRHPMRALIGVGAA